MTGVEGPGADGAATSGGQIIRIRGNYFGTIQHSRGKVVMTYGPRGFETKYTAGVLACAFSVAQQLIFVGYCVSWHAMWVSIEWRCIQLFITLAFHMYGAAECFVETSHVSISCLTVPGTGFNHTLQVTIDGVRSDVNPAVLQAYGSPSIVGYSDAGSIDAFTRGMQVG